METVKTWAFSVSAAAICGSVISLIIPDGEQQKIYKVVFCVFFLCIVAAPFSEITIPNLDEIASFFKPEVQKTAEENIFTENNFSIIEDEIVSSVNEIIESEGIFAKDISVKINISENGGIDINKFVLTLDRTENISAIKEKILQKTGIEPEIIISGENDNG